MSKIFDLAHFQLWSMLWSFQKHVPSSKSTVQILHPKRLFCAKNLRYYFEKHQFIFKKYISAIIQRKSINQNISLNQNEFDLNFLLLCAQPFKRDCFGLVDDRTPDSLLYDCYFQPIESKLIIQKDRETGPLEKVA